ncbi:MAG: YihY family inner membrane protein [Phycisphaerae bacterium]|nr:YihY family inner membrane protein [Phycisphaerae bacterium]
MNTLLIRLLSQPIGKEPFSGWGRFLFFQIRLWRHCIRLLKVNRSGTQAAALSYHTVFGIVPLAIVMLMVFQLFPAYRDLGIKVREFIYRQAHLASIEYSVRGPAETEAKTVRLTDQIDQITDRFLSGLDTGAVTLISGLLMIWAAIGLLETIERAFNTIWGVARNRSFFHRIINYWTMLTLGPLLLGLGIYMTTHYLSGGMLTEGWMKYLRPIWPFFFSTAALFFLYFLMPNASVNAKAALWGAVVAGLCWTAAKHAFGVYLLRFIPYQAVYGVLGLIPLGVWWIYITWLIVLFGLQLTYATQYLTTLDAAELAAMRKNDEAFIADEYTVMRMMGWILEEYYRRQAPVTVEGVAGRLGLPVDFARKLLDHLVATNLLFLTTEPGRGYCPATDGRKITLEEIAKAVRKASFVSLAGDDESKIAELRDAHLKELGSMWLTDLTKENPVVKSPTSDSSSGSQFSNSTESRSNSDNLPPSM